MLRLIFRVALVSVVALAIAACATPASRTDAYHWWIDNQRICDAPLSSHLSREDRERAQDICGMHPRLPPECEKPGTYDLPACQDWIDQVRSLPGYWTAGYTDNYTYFRY